MAEGDRARLCTSMDGSHCGLRLVSNNMNPLKTSLMRLPALKIIFENWSYKAAAIRIKFVLKQVKICPLFNL